MPVLEGIHIVTMALNAPGPLAASYLHQAGARVTKVEPPTGDPLATFCAGWYRELHEGIAVERLDLKSGEGQARMRQWIGTADLFLSSQRPAALRRLQLDPTSLAARAETRAARTLNIVGERARPEIAGHDLTYLAQAGLLGREIPRTLFADVMAAERAFSTALQLLREPPGTAAEVGLFDSLAPLVALKRHGLTGAGNLLGGALPAYGIYDARQGRVAIAALEPHFRERVYGLLDLPPGSALSDIMKSRTAAEWEAWGESHDVPIARCHDE
jgi:alpha-methylacyl-CoA racemase